ncbi:hypothetical protein KRP22_005961 [Phytophthora ramorum]|uniref:uncharacterized protein n=1 Tax=Phytophthora ramorum TaxID=164328 RepID=UPI00309F786F|nr:hypothetical protein KRP23_3851 [Phytophthora ramorum]KAH7507813.1 hypothetical protein KRP22_2908 [Phytophthora ramorum]
MATSTELSELERGDGVWENIQEVLRFGFRGLWKAFAGVDSRIMELDKALAAQKNDSQRQQQHLGAIAKTLSVMSEQLRLGQDEAANQQVEARLQNVEYQLRDQLVEGRRSVVDDSTANKANIAKAERRLALLEDEMGRVVAAIDQKAEAEALVEQGRTLQEAIRRRCKKEAFDQEVLGLQNRLQQQRGELEKQLSASFLELKTAQETLLHSEMASWAAKTHENTVKSVQPMVGQATQQQTGTLRAINDEVQHCYEALTAQQKQMDEVQADIGKQVRSAIAADREDIARQCSEAHGRIDYQFRTQEEALERVRGEQRVLQEEIAATGRKRAEQTVTEMTAAVEALDRRVLDREHQELEKLHGQLTEEIQLTIANALKALEPAKDKEQRRLKQHQHVVARKLAELDQMMQLIGRQLVQNTSQLQVVRNEQLVHNLRSEDPDYDDNELLLQYDSIAQSTVLAGVAPAPVSPGLQQADQIEAGPSEQTAATAQEDTAELQARRSQHQELQEQLDKKLHDYSQLLDSANDEEETHRQSTQPPKR